MKKLNLAIVALFILSISILAMGSLNSACAADEMTIQGTVNAEGQLVAGDQVYVIEQNESGKALAGMVDKKVEVKGVVSENEGVKTIQVNSYNEVQ